MYLRHPVGFIHKDYLEITSLDAGSVCLLAAHPAFSRSINRIIARQAGTDTFDLSEAWLRSLKCSDEHQIAFDLATSQEELLVSTANKVASIHLYHHLRNCVKKSRRNLIENYIGAQAFLTSLREAPVLYPHLVEKGKEIRIDALLAGDPKAADFEGMPSPASADDSFRDLNPVVWLGLSTLFAFLKNTDSICSSLFVLRFPKSAVSRHVTEQTMTKQQMCEVTHLLKHRGGAR
ncbi:type III secretion protein [Stappia aggregata IAM 12614]|uniref:Type III secretion protein n=2 Tax=Roseibium aggregatum TaxID=187304 RepID=A0P0K8_ROSAI|nr:type III secretion protein [Stappia aggregata IAM 12614] [Roseibium aggregatum IAM 12614]